MVAVAVVVTAAVVAEAEVLVAAAGVAEAADIVTATIVAEATGIAKAAVLASAAVFAAAAVVVEAAVVAKAVVLITATIVAEAAVIAKAVVLVAAAIVAEAVVLVIVVIDYGAKTGTRRQDSVFMILPPPIHVQLRCLFTLSHPKVNSEDLRKLRNTKRTNSNREALQQPMSVIPIRLIDVPQHALVCFVESLGQFFKPTPHSRY